MAEIFGIIVTYNPEIINLEKNISSIIVQVDKLFVFDNGSKNRKDIQKLQEKFPFEAVYSNENVGLSKAYNQIILSNINNCEYFVTFDQDSYIPKNTIKTLLDIIENSRDLGALGPLFDRKTEFVKNKGEIHFVSVIIQSCAIFRTSAIAETGGFNEHYFIDSVDFEYCLRLIEKGYKIANYDGVCIKHELGAEKKFFGITYYSHNKLRNYYIARNHMDITRRFYKSFPKFVFKKNFFLSLHFLKLFVFERDLEKINYFIKGIKNKKL